MDKAVKSAHASDGLMALGNTAIKSTVGTVTASVGTVTSSVGDMLSGKMPYDTPTQAPKFNDVTTQEAFEKVKDYSVKTNLRVERIGLVSQLFNQFAGLFWSAIGTATGVIVGLALNNGALAIPAMTAPIVGTMLAGALTLTLAGFAARQFMVRQQTEKGMDISDYHLRREAKLIGQEVERVQDKVMEASKEPLRGDGKAWTQALAEQEPVSHERTH